MNKKRVIFNCTLEQYNKKYRNRKHRLIKYTKKQIEDFDKQYGHYEFNDKTYKLEHDHYLLKDRKWTLIGDTYYEIPKPVRLSWFRNLSARAQAAICLLGTAVVSSSIIFPTLSVTVWNKDNTPKQWYEDKLFIDGLTKTDVGLEKELTVNGQIHKVRLIDIDHDDLLDGKGKAHTTWEFVNLISDTDGNSLAYQWNDPVNQSFKNYDYLNSTIRFALTGEGTNGGKKNKTILVAQKGKTSWSINSNYDKTILSMLPEKLVKNLKIVKKSAGIGSTYTETFYYDKLFMLSAIEMGYNIEVDKGFGTTYSYYNGHTESEDKIRIKKQVNNSETFDDYITIPSGSGQAYKYSVVNFAGYNSSTNNEGGYYLLRSPSSNGGDGERCFWCSGVGSVFDNWCCSSAVCVAPAFCL